MADTQIEWATDVWNPVVGCSLVSTGCAHCYAVPMTWRHMHNPVGNVADDYAGLVQKHPNGQLDWTGKVRFLPDRLLDPLKWRKPRRVFVNSMSDLFHESLSFEDIDKVFDVMLREDHHTYIVLTKRPERMAAYITNLFRCPPCPTHIWLGVSVENQAMADERIPKLLQTPAAVRFISAEPLLGLTDLSQNGGTISAFDAGLNWVICGGESGPGARPMHPNWARTIRNQCVAAGVPFFFKQWGNWGPKSFGRECPYSIVGLFSGSDSALDVRMWRVGKKRAGRVLDGRTWDQYPKGTNS